MTAIHPRDGGVRITASTPLGDYTMETSWVVAAMAGAASWSGSGCGAVRELIDAAAANLAGETASTASRRIRLTTAEPVPSFGPPRNGGAAMQAPRSRLSPVHDAARGVGGVFAGPFIPVMIALVALAIGAILFFKPSDPRALRDGGAIAVAASPKSTRPALTAEEERYIRALWPIHGEVERSTMRMSLGQIFYTTKDLGAPELKARVEQALNAYKNAQTRIQGLQAPASLRAQHDDYLAAVRLFEESANEIMKMFTDGRDDHLLAAHPKGQAGADKIREIGGRFWPNEFAPH